MINNANLCLVTGRLVRDFDMRTNENGKAYAYGSVAVQRNFKNKSGEFDCDFIDFEVSGPNAEFMAKYFHKGDPVSLSGCLRQRSSKVKFGDEEKTITRLIVVVEQASFVPGAAKNSGAQAQTSAAQTVATPVQTSPTTAQPDFTPIPSTGDFPFGEGGDDSLPF